MYSLTLLLPVYPMASLIWLLQVSTALLPDSFLVYRLRLEYGH